MFQNQDTSEVTLLLAKLNNLEPAIPTTQKFAFCGGKKAIFVNNLYLFIILHTTYLNFIKQNIFTNTSNLNVNRN